MKKIKVVLYWLAVVPVIVDLVKGAISGVKKGLVDLKLAEQEAQWHKANHGE